MRKESKILVLILMLMAVFAINANSQTASEMKLSRPWTATYNPVGAPASGFSKTDVLNVTSTETSWKYDFTLRNWYQVDVGYWADAVPIPGPAGPSGKDGVCPPCPSNNVGGTFGSYGTSVFVSTFAEYKSATQLSLTGAVRKIYIVNSFTQTEKLRVSNTVNNPSTSLTIDQGNNRITIASGIDTAFVRSFPDYTTANTKVDFQLRVENGEFKADKNCIIFFLSSCYQGHFENCKFFGGKTAIDARWNLAGNIRECRFDDWGYVAVNLEFDGMPGGSNVYTQTNHYLLFHNNFRSPSKTTPNAFACVRSKGNSGILDWHNIYEGGDWLNNNNGCDYAVWNDDNGSTTVKDWNSWFSHIEFTPAIAGFYNKQANGCANYVGIYSQKECILFQCQSSGYTRFSFRDIPFMTEFTKIQNLGTGGRFYFQNCPGEFNPLDVKRWAGVRPDSTYINQLPGINPDGQNPVFYLGKRKI